MRVSRLGIAPKHTATYKAVLPVIMISFCLALCGCGSSSDSSLRIVVQPASRSEPLAQPATFSVVAQGSSALTYQWSRNGIAIQGATSASYTTPPVAASDAGASFAVTVSEGAQSLVSNSAVLTVGPRSPAAQDIRFQLVASPATAQGYQGLISTAIGTLGPVSATYYNAIGKPLIIGVPNCGTPSQNPGCVWFFGTFVPPSTTLDVNYSTGQYANFSTYLSGLPDSTVLSSMELDPQMFAFAVSSISTQTASGFDAKLETVPSLNALASAVALDAASGRVVTAISNDGANLSFVSYGWTGDTNTVYETQVLGASFAQLPTFATQLASDGYIITAVGGSTAQGFTLIGTRVRGDSLPRQMLIGSGTTLASMSAQGYAIVAAISGSEAIPIWFGEK